tara:strand:+ start:114 stop:467 length:354 start_codon:yes stop_codon:yes gene_type:complete
MFPNACSQEHEQIVFHKNHNHNKPNERIPTLSHEQSRTLKLSQTDEPIVEKKTTLDMRKLIQSTRQTMNMSQKELACKLNVNTSVINELESGKMKSPPPQLIQKLNNVLKLKIKLVT